MEILERYLLAIERYLPKKDKQEVTNELRSLLMDQFEAYDDPNVSEEDKMKAIIKEFGFPIEVATKYKTDKPMILREFEPFMMLLFKIVGISVPSALLFAKALEVYSNTANISTGHLLLELLKAIPSILMAVVTGFGVIFIIFTGISQQIDPDKINEEFDPDTLPQIPEDIYKVSLIEAIISVAGGFVFLYVFNYQPGLVAVYYDNVREPLLNSNFDKILPFLNISIALSIILHGYYLFKQQKSKLTVSLEAVFMVYSGIILILLSNADIFNTVLVDGYNLEIIPTLFKIGMIVGAVGSFIGAIVTLVKVFLAKEKGE